ncbi:CsbD family protein [Rhodopila sp.]|uniref:CsbD family protein n=1 Tax=Rhodopila sp. TaxID=2480087 RepID=UPI003D0C0843
MDDRIEGTAREFGGRVQQAAGNLTGDGKTQAQGVYNQASGQAQQAASQFSDVVKAQPIVASLVALAIGYVLGRLTA